MATELGVGTRVFVGWCPDAYSCKEIVNFDGRCKTGTITSGPDEFPCRHWDVKFDEGPEYGVAEYLLQPIDSDPETLTEEERGRKQHEPSHNRD